MKLWGPVAVVVLLLAGCKGGGPEVVKIDPTTATFVQPGPAAPGQGEWEALSAPIPFEENEHSRYLSPSDARKCPTLKVFGKDDETMKLVPGQPGFAPAGQVTLILSWAMEFRQGRAAARHVSDLVKKYRQFGVGAVGIVQRTPGVAESATFQAQQGLSFRVYQDSLGALKALRKAVGAQDKLNPAVSIFIVDRRMRLRFYRAEFRFSATSKASGRGGLSPELIEESAPPGRAVEDYLQAILREGR